LNIEENDENEDITPTETDRQNVIARLTEIGIPTESVPRKHWKNKESLLNFVRSKEKEVKEATEKEQRLCQEQFRELMQYIPVSEITKLPSYVRECSSQLAAVVAVLKAEKDKTVECSKGKRNIFRMCFT
jgi:chromatin segregation and condensation protein Rec8/ScpA/Scc1 (kleisin family)